MIDFLNYVPVRGSVGEMLLKLTPLFLLVLLIVLAIYLIIRETDKCCWRRQNDEI